MKTQKKKKPTPGRLSSFSRDPLWLYLLGITGLTFLLVDSTRGYFLVSLLSVFSVVTIYILYLGENLLLQQKVAIQLNKFDDQHKILSSIQLTDGRRQSCSDYIVISPKGIFNLRLLDFEGKLVGYENDEYWNYLKIVNPYDVVKKTIKNPLHSHKETQDIIEELLERNYIKYIPIQSLFIINNTDALVESDSNIPIVKVKDLYNFINEYQDRSSMKPILQEVHRIIVGEGLSHFHINCLSIK